MEPRIFHGTLTPTDIAQVLVAEFNHGNLYARPFGEEQQVIVQISSTQIPRAGGQTALSVVLKQVEDGVAVQIGTQEWLGIAASLGQTAFEALRNPWNLLGRLDDLSQDIENLQLTDQVWALIENYARTAGATFELSDRLRRLVCSYCNTANPIGEPNCIACGAPLGDVQPRTCKNCGFVVKSNEVICPNCKKRL
jgi:hypothetical protein